MDGGKAVNVHEGLNRIASVFKVLGLLWLVGWIASGIFMAVTETSSKLAFLMLAAAIGIVGYAVGAALAWVIRGFAQPRS